MKFNRDLLLQLRKAKKLSRDALGKASGITGQAIWKIECGRTKSPDIPTINALAAALEVSPALFFEEPANLDQQLA